MKLTAGVAAAVMFVIGIGAPFAAHTEESLRASQHPKKTDKASDEVDTEHIFGFTEGSDLGEAGAKELELVSSGRFGKRSGFYAATSTALFYKYSPVDHVRVAPIVSFSSHNIRNVPGLENLSQSMLEGTGIELRYRLWDREKAPVGLTLSATPFFSRVDPLTGSPTEQYGVETAILLDKELIPERLFAALNILYEPEWSRSKPSNRWEGASTFGIGGAISTRVAPGLFLGAEARYFRNYEGTGLNTFSGDALFVGPTLFKKLSKDWFASVAWNSQIAGHAVGEPGRLDLTNSERHEIRFRLGVDLH